MTNPIKEIGKCAQNASKRLWACKTIQEVENMDKTPRGLNLQGKKGVFQGGSGIPSPMDKRDCQVLALEDHYSNTLAKMTDEEVAIEYSEKVI